VAAWRYRRDARDRAVGFERFGGTESGVGRRLQLPRVRQRRRGIFSRPRQGWSWRHAVTSELENQGFGPRPVAQRKGLRREVRFLRVGPRTDFATARCANAEKEIAWAAGRNDDRVRQRLTLEHRCANRECWIDGTLKGVTVGGVYR
jgi:hypothetical protein